MGTRCASLTKSQDDALRAEIARMLTIAGEKLRDPKLGPVRRRATDTLVRAGPVKRDATKRREQERLRLRNELAGMVRWQGATEYPPETSWWTRE